MPVGGKSMNTVLAFLTVIVLAVAGLGFGRTTEGMVDPLEMAKLGLHQMPNGDWMAVDPPGGPAQPAASVGGGEHAGHNVPNDGQSLLERKNRQSGQPQQQHRMSPEQMKGMSGMHDMSGMQH